MGGAHVEALRRLPGVHVVAIAGRTEERGRTSARALDIPRAYGDPYALIADPEVDVVHNCLPNHLHLPLNMAALAAGKHVISEKPLALNSRETATLVEFAEHSGLVTAVNFAYRYYPLVQHMRAMIQGGALGTVYLVRGAYLQDWLLSRRDYNWRVDPDRGGPYRALGDIGSHWCDLVQYVTGRRITHVCAQSVIVHKTRPRPPAEAITFQAASPGAGIEVPVVTEDAATVLIRFAGGSAGLFVVSQVSAGHKNGLTLEIDCAEGALRWNQEQPEELWIGHRDRPNEILPKDPALLNERARAFAHYPGGHPEGYPDGIKNLFANVYAHITDRSVPAEFPTFHEAHEIVRLIEAVGVSNQEGGWIEAKC